VDRVRGKKIQRRNSNRDGGGSLTFRRTSIEPAFSLYLRKAQKKERSEEAVKAAAKFPSSRKKKTDFRRVDGKGGRLAVVEKV